MRRLVAAALASLCGTAWADEDVPFVVTPEPVVLAMLEIAGVGPEDYLIDLGSGDGRIVITAAKRFGARGLGVDNDPQRVAESRENARKAGVGTQAIFREQDLFKTDLAPASVITMYLLPEVNLQLRPKLLKLRPGTRIVSHDWDMGDWQPDKTRQVPAPYKETGREKMSRVHFWVVPARIEGTWCGAGKAKGARLDVGQLYQRFRGELVFGGDTHALEGRIQGYSASVPRRVAFHLEGDKLRAQAIDRKFSPLHRTLFTRSKTGAC